MSYKRIRVYVYKHKKQVYFRCRQTTIMEQLCILRGDKEHGHIESDFCSPVVLVARKYCDANAITS